MACRAQPGLGSPQQVQRFLSGQLGGPLRGSSPLLQAPPKPGLTEAGSTAGMKLGWEAEDTMPTGCPIKHHKHPRLPLVPLGMPYVSGHCLEVLRCTAHTMIMQTNACKHTALGPRENVALAIWPYSALSDSHSGRPGQGEGVAGSCRDLYGGCSHCEHSPACTHSRSSPLGLQSDIDSPTHAMQPSPLPLAMQKSCCVAPPLHPVPYSPPYRPPHRPPHHP